MRKIFTEITAGIVGIAAVVGAWLSGYYLSKLNNSTAFAAAAICYAALVLLAVNSFLVKKRTPKFSDNLNEPTNNDAANFQPAFAEQKKEENDSTQSVIIKNLKRSICKLKIRVALLTALTLAACYFSGAAEVITEDEGGFSLAFIPFMALLAQGFAAYFIYSAKMHAEKHEYPVSEKDYPLITKTIKDAAAAAGYKGKINVFLEPDKISVTKYDSVANVKISAEESALYTKNELYAKIYHDFTVAQKSEELYRITNRLKFLPENAPSVMSRKLFFEVYYQRTLFKAKLSELYAIKRNEQAADDMINDGKVAQDFLNATAKTALFSMYSLYPWGEMNYDVYRETTPVKDYTHRNLQNFKQKYLIYGKNWNKTLTCELEEKSSVRPTVKSRAEKFGMQPVIDFSFEEEQPYKNEQEQLLTYSDSACLKHMDEKSYLAEREHAYTERKECMDKYNEAVNENNLFLPAHELVECAQAFTNIDDQIALKILNELGQDNLNTLAVYLKGLILSKNYDEGCVELFRAAADDPVCTEAALEQISEFAVKTGNRELYEENLGKIASKNRRSEEILGNTSLSDKILTPVDYNDPQNSEMIRTLVGFWEDDLSELHGVETLTEDGVRVIYFALTFAKNAKPQTLAKKYEDSLNYITRLMNKSCIIYVIVSGKELAFIKKIKNSLLYKSDSRKNA